MEYTEKFKWDIEKDKEGHLQQPPSHAEGLISLTQTEYRALKERSEALAKIQCVVDNLVAKCIYKE